MVWLRVGGGLSPGRGLAQSVYRDGADPTVDRVWTGAVEPEFRMNNAHQQANGRISLDQAADWAALGREVRRRAAVMTAVHVLSPEPGDERESASPVIRLGREGRP